MIMALMLMISQVASSPDEAKGRVSKAVDGDTFDVVLTLEIPLGRGMAGLGRP